ncbi:hypothetical protein ACM66B_002506 [Microbotryomycetes sp. NB124-2]
MPGQRAALVIIDLQYDFLPGGALGVANGHEVVTVVERLLDAIDWALVVASQDLHPSHHVSFASRHQMEPFTSTLVPRPGRSELWKQELWPDHCVQGTRGCHIHASIKERLDSRPQAAVHVIHKGTDADVDEYSAFASDESKLKLKSLLKEHDIKTLFVVGLATDFCVRASTLDALTLVSQDVRVYIVREGVKGVDDTRSRETVLPELEAAGACLVSEHDIKSLLAD